MVVNTWDNSDADNVYSNDNNWSQDHKPATGEDVVIPDTSGIGKCTMDENSAADLASFTIQASGEFECATFTLDINGDFSNSGTFTCGTGTVQFGGAGVQNVTSGGSAFYHVVLVGAGTIYYTKDDTEMFDINIGSGTTFEIDAVNEGALTISFIDTVGCGFIQASAGALLCQGNSGNRVTITTAAAGAPTNYWWGLGDGNGWSIIADYTTFAYHFQVGVLPGASGTQTIDIDNCIFENFSSAGFVFGHGTFTSFSNNTIQNSTATYGIYIYQTTPTNLDNIVITANTTNSVYCAGAGAEFVDSNFDLTRIRVITFFVSRNHNDVANDYQVYLVSTRNLTDISAGNRPSATDNVTLNTGTLRVNANMATRDVDIKSGATLILYSPPRTWTITDTGTVTVRNGATLTMVGTAGNLITLVSSTPGTQWSMDAEVGSTVTCAYVDVTDSDATPGEEINATSNCTDSGNNDNWNFGGAIPAASISMLVPLLQPASASTKGNYYKKELVAGNAKGYEFCNPQAIYFSDLTYFAYIDTTNDKVMIRAWNHTTKTWSTAYEIATNPDDDGHRAPSIAKMPNDKLLVCYGCHADWMHYKISTDTHTNISSDMTKLANWGAEQNLAPLQEYSYPHALSFAAKTVLFFRVGWSTSGDIGYNTTADGVTWTGEATISETIAPNEGCYYWVFRKVGDRIMMCGCRWYVAPTSERQDVYFAYSDDEGANWKKADGTALSVPFPDADAKVLTVATFCSPLSVMLDEDDKPVILVAHSVGGVTTMKLAVYSGAIGGAGSWSLETAVDEEDNDITAYGPLESCGLFADNDSGEPVMWVSGKVSGNNQIQRYQRQPSETAKFSQRWVEGPVLSSGYGSAYANENWNAPDKSVEVVLGQNVDAGAYDADVYMFGLHES